MSTIEHRRRRLCACRIPEWRPKLHFKAREPSSVAPDPRPERCHEPDRPVPAAPPPAPETVAPAGEGDDLRRIKGLGPKLVSMLHDLGVSSYTQIAAWTEADIDRIDPQLGAFAGRIRRDSWVEQAKFLAAGDTEGFEAKFGKL